jgi:hypothetical protein
LETEKATHGERRASIICKKMRKQLRYREEKVHGYKKRETFQLKQEKGYQNVKISQHPGHTEEEKPQV